MTTTTVTANDELRASAAESLRSMTTRNSSDSMRSDYEAMAAGTMGESREEKIARERRELMASRSGTEVVISFDAHGIGADRPGIGYAGLGFYNSVEAAVNEATSVKRPSSTGHDNNVWFWDLTMDLAVAEVVRDSLIRRGWSMTTIELTAAQ